MREIRDSGELNLLKCHILKELFTKEKDASGYCDFQVLGASKGFGAQDSTKLNSPLGVRIR